MPRPVRRAREHPGPGPGIGRPFAGLPADEQFQALKEIEGSDFFELVRSTAVTEVYSDQRTASRPPIRGASH